MAMILSGQLWIFVIEPSSWPRQLQMLMSWEERMLPPSRMADNYFTCPPAMVQTTTESLYARGGISRNSNDSKFWVAVYRTDKDQPHVFYDKHRFTPTKVRFSPSGRLAVSADLLGEIHLWNVNDGSNVLWLKGDHRELYGVSWSGKDRIMVSTKAYGQNAYAYGRYGQRDQEFRLFSRDRLRSKVPNEPMPNSNRTSFEVSSRILSLKPIIEKAPLSLDVASNRTGERILPLSDPKTSINAHCIYQNDSIICTESGKLVQLRFVSPTRDPRLVST